MKNNSKNITNLNSLFGHGHSDHPDGRNEIWRRRKPFKMSFFNIVLNIFNFKNEKNNFF